MASLVLRTGDNLRQIASLTDTHPETAACAMRGEGGDTGGTSPLFCEE